MLTALFCMEVETVNATNCRASARSPALYRGPFHGSRQWARIIAALARSMRTWWA